MQNRKGHELRQRRLYEVVECLKNQMNTTQIADELGVTVRTARKYVQYIRENQEE